MVQPGRMQARPVMAVVAALAYGMMGEILFQEASDVLLGTLSISFLFLVPVGIGAVTVALLPSYLRTSWPYAIFAPWAVSALLGIVVWFLAREAWICVVMGLPIFFVMGSVGGALMRWWFERREARGRNNQDDPTLLGVILLTPFLFAPIEAQVQRATVVREVESVVAVSAPAATIWEEFVVVPAIQEDEAGFAWFKLAGLPEPVEAMLSAPGSTGVRHASYDNGIRVIEPVRVWEPYTRYRFDVLLDPESAQAMPLWGAVSGDHLKVEWVEYRLEPVQEGEIRLYLTTRYALTTPLNPYAVRWVDFLLSDFQRYILQVVKGRAEQTTEQAIEQAM